jgi:hypothetical protein
MKLRLLLSSAFLAGAAVLLPAREAKALGPLDVEIAGRVGYGAAPSDLPTNPYGVGFGARGGVSILGFYGGLSVMDYLGSSADVALTNNSGVATATNASVSYKALMYGIDAGWGLKLAILTIRGQIGLGNLTYSIGDQSFSHVYVEPGVVGLISLGTWFVGADVNYLVVPSLDTGLGTSKTYSAPTFHGQIGVTF